MFCFFLADVSYLRKQSTYKEWLEARVPGFSVGRRTWGSQLDAPSKSAPSTLSDKLRLQKAGPWGKPATGTGRPLTEPLAIISLVMGLAGRGYTVNRENITQEK